MLLQRTAKAHEELQPGQRQLPLRERSVLLMAGGRTLAQLQHLLGDEHAALARTLIARGYLQAQEPATEATPHPEPAPDAASRPALNLPGTRMYLFDLCERLFANRHEALAQSLRMQLREARDLPALRSAGLALLDAVQQHAGEERAAFLRGQLAGLLQQAREAEPETVPG
jgi:hypothetical protein